MKPLKTPALRPLLPWLALAALIVLADQASKIAVLRSFALGEVMALTSWFNLTLTYNPGAAFSFLANAGGWQKYFFILMGLAASLVIIVLLSKHHSQRRFATALALIMGGAIGNVIDRIAYGHVVDFIDWHYAGWHWPAFNLADSAIVGGAVLMVFDELIRAWRHRASADSN
ncbi:MAG TPA: signal peptidase II [Burkholderiaceae bacterium]|nr:signal peptidase II [Burkholderiaceae bacterium]